MKQFCDNECQLSGFIENMLETSNDKRRSIYNVKNVSQNSNKIIHFYSVKLSMVNYSMNSWAYIIASIVILSIYYENIKSLQIFSTGLEHF